jgi:imidazole glycerol-phosphate synthase subunit HisF
VRSFAQETKNTKSIDQDGMMKGYDMSLIQKIREAVSIPITVMGGAGSLEDIGNIISTHGIIGVSAGSIFVFKGKFRAVLINYPTSQQKEELIKKYFIASKK